MRKDTSFALVTVALILVSCQGTPPSAVPTSPPLRATPIARETKPIATVMPVPTILSSLSPTPDDSMSAPEDALKRFAPQPGDAHLTRGTVHVRHAEVLLLESYPVQVHLLLQGALPSPCHQLRLVVHEADAEKRIFIEAYSVTNPKMMCAQVIREFEVEIPLGSYTEGHYTIWINKEKVAEFDI